MDHCEMKIEKRLAKSARFHVMGKPQAIMGVVYSPSVRRGTRHRTQGKAALYDEALTELRVWDVCRQGKATRLAKLAKEWKRMAATVSGSA